MLPLGTILTVTKCTELDGWEEVNSFNSDIEPVQVGEVKLSLGIESDTEVWKEWNSINLEYYPELKNTVHFYIENMPLNSNRKLWENYFELGILPPITDYFPKFGNSKSLGIFDLGKTSYPLVMPFIEHTENVLKPIGRSTDEPPKKLYSPVLSGNTEINNTKPNIPSNFVLLAQKASIHNLESTPVYISNENNAEISIPPHINFKLMVCTQTHYSGVPLTHKLIIKVR